MKALFLVAVLLWSRSAVAQGLEKITVSAPGPRNISYLPIDIIPKIGVDRELGVSLQILHTGGGAVALNNLVTRNADFSVAGLPAAMSLRANGGDVVAVAAVDDAPLFILMVRSGLKGSVRRIADLKGKVIGVNTSTKNSKTTSQQLAELLLKHGGVDIDAVRIVPAGQSWVEQSSLMVTATADAIMGDEPFASRLQTDGKVYFLTNLADKRTAKNIPGGNFLHAALETRSDVIRNSPQKVEKMVRMVQKSLHWIATHRPEDVVDKLGITDRDERDALLLSLKKYPHAFSKDGKFSSAQLRETGIFFHAASHEFPQAQGLEPESMVNDRWSGRRP
jgi:NitT/TauT family transport system substrate-binding protein